MASGKLPVFVRSATGLVRSMTARDMLFLNVVSFGGAWSIIYALEYAPLYGGNPIVSLLLTVPGILALLGVYYVFQVAMPRSGGDYVFMSRALHPAIGLAANFAGYSFFLWFWIGEAVTLFSTFGLAPTLSVYGSLTGQQWAADAAAAFSSPITIFVVGTIALAIFAAVVLTSTRLYFWIQNIAMIVAILAIVVIIGLLAATTPSSFASVLNDYASKQSIALSPTAYQNITAAGTNYWGGSVPTDPTSGYTFTLIPLWFTVLFWVYVSNYCGGETKNVRSSARTALFGSFAVIFVATIAVLGIAYSNLGAEFLTGAGYYAYGYAANPLPVIPNLTLFSALLANNPLLVWFVGIGMIAGFVLVAPQCMILMSRILFGYSFDRVAPSFVSDVSDRWHTPVKGILIAVAGGEIFLVFLSGLVGPVGPTVALLLYSYVALAAVGVTFTFVAISAIIFPFRRKQLYETAFPIKRKIGGVPLITWLGIVALVYILATIGYYSLNYNFYFGAGTLLATSYFPFLGAVAGLFVASIAWYYIARSVRTKAGIPFEMAFKEIPPE